MCSSPPVLALPKAGRIIYVNMDACDRQVGCYLLQEQPSRDLSLIVYLSRTQSKPERKHSATEIELLAVVHSAIALRPYLECARFMLATDDRLYGTFGVLATTIGELRF